MALTEGLGGFLSVSAATPATFSVSGYAALSWTEVGEASEIPESGPAHAVNAFTPLKTGIVNKFHGELDYGSITVPLGYDSADAGQIILLAALASKNEISFRQTPSDGTVRYIMGKVTSFPRGQSVGSVDMASCNIKFTRADVEVSPLFAGGKQGALLTAFDIGTLFQLSVGTTPVTVATDPIGYFGDTSGNSNHAIQATAAQRLTYQTTPARARVDKVDDRLSMTVPVGGFTGTMVLATDQGTASYGVTIPAGAYDIGGKGGLYFPGTAIVGQLIRDGALTAAEAEATEAYFVRNGATASYGAVTSFFSFWRSWSELTSFPLIDTSSGTSLSQTWHSCTSLTSFPLIDTSSVTDFLQTWRNCFSLTSFPLIDTSSGTNFSSAWYSCTSLTSFPLIDTSSGTNFISAWYGCTGLTSFPLIDTSAGTSFSQAWDSCTGLTSFPLIDTSAGTSFYQAWYSCTSLTSFPLIDTSSGTSLSQTWHSCANLTSFPLIDTSSVTDFLQAWYSCTSLTSFPLIDTSSGTNFSSAWYGCTGLTSFPSNAFDNISGGNFTDAFTNTALTQTSIDNILVSLVASGIAVGTRVFGQSGGSAPSSTGEAAITTLRSRGWTVTVTGGY
jgi:hypothetical protein